MDLKRRVYSVLLVSPAEKFNTVFTDLLPPSDYSPVTVASDVNTAKREMSDRGFDFVIVNSVNSADKELAFSIDTVDSCNSVVLLLSSVDVYDEIHDSAVDHGVYMLGKPVSKTSLIMALDWMASARERLRKTEKKTLTIEEKMNEIRIVNRAKWLLISEVKMDEPSAHRFIEKQAMDRCISKREVAEDIIKTYG